MDAAKIEALATSETNLETGMLALRLNRVGKAKSIIRLRGNQKLTENKRFRNRLAHFNMRC